METTFSFNGRMMAMLGVVLVLLMVLSFCLGMLYGESVAASPAGGRGTLPLAADKAVVKGEAK